MSGIPAGSIIHVGGKTVLNRLQDAGLQDPRVPTEVVYEVGNDLVVGKIQTEADFRFQMTSWDVSCDMLALLNGKTASGLGHQITESDAAGTAYRWDTCGFINVCSPWKSDTGAQGGHIHGGVVVPNLYPTAISYRLGVTANAQAQVTLSTGSYYMARGSTPVEEFAAGDGTVVAFVTSQPAVVHRIGGHGSTLHRYVSGVMVNSIPQIEGVDYVVTGGAAPEVTQTAVTITFAIAPPAAAVVKYCYFSTTAHTIAQAMNLDTTVTPAAVRGRDITILVGDPGASPLVIHGVQDFQLDGTINGTVQREMGNYDPIGFTQTGIDTNGTVTIEPKDIDSLFSTLSTMLGIDESEVFGYLNVFSLPLTAVIHDPKNPANIIKSIYMDDATFQAPGDPQARVNTTTSFPLRFESVNGTFREIKGQLPA